MRVFRSLEAVRATEDLEEPGSRATNTPASRKMGPLLSSCSWFYPKHFDLPAYNPAPTCVTSVRFLPSSPEISTQGITASKRTLPPARDQGLFSRLMTAMDCTT
jgi:hypothetical protein